MAGKKTGRKGRKKTKRMKLATMPTQRTIALSAGEDSQSRGLIQVSKLLSQMNSRLYRQGFAYDVQFQLGTETAPYYQVDFYTLPNTWFTHGAIKRAFSIYRAMMQDELMETGGRFSKWHDFKINPAGTDDSPDSNNFYPNFWDGDSWVDLTAGFDNDHSRATDNAGTLQFFAINGSVSGSYDIFQEYANHLLSRKADSSTEAGPQSYEGAVSGSDDSDRLLEVGETPPYDEDFLMWHNAGDADTDSRLVFQDSLYLGKGSDSDDTSSSPSGSRVMTRSFTAPLGLVWVEATANFTRNSDSELILRVPSGKYKGVKAEPIFHFDMLGATAKSLR